MGLLDSLLKTGMRAARNAVADAVSDVVSDAVSGAMSGAMSGAVTDARKENSTPTVPVESTECDDRSFDQKLQEILQKLGEYEVRRNVSPDELEQEAGREIYTRGGCYAKPDNLSYVLYRDGQRVLVINLWWSYESYRHVANREIKNYCTSNGIKVLDFFNYLPNEADYMEERICAQL